MLTPERRKRLATLAEMVRFPSDSRRTSPAEWDEEHGGSAPPARRYSLVPDVRRHLADVLSYGNLLYTAWVQGRWDRISESFSELVSAMGALLAAAVPPRLLLPPARLYRSSVLERWGEIAGRIRRVTADRWIEGMAAVRAGMGNAWILDWGFDLPGFLRRLQRAAFSGQGGRLQLVEALSRVAKPLDGLLAGTALGALAGVDFWNLREAVAQIPTDLLDRE